MKSSHFQLVSFLECTTHLSDSFSHPFMESSPHQACANICFPSARGSTVGIPSFKVTPSTTGADTEQ